MLTTLLTFFGIISTAIAATTTTPRPANASLSTVLPGKCASLDDMTLNTTSIYGFDDRRDRLAGGAVIVAALTSMGNDFFAINRNITEEYRLLFGDLGWSTASGLDTDSWDVDIPASSPGFIRGRVAGKRVTISRPKRSPLPTPEVELIKLASNSSIDARWIGSPTAYYYDEALMDKQLISQILRLTTSSSLSSLSAELEREFNLKYGGVWMCVVTTSPAAFTFNRPALISSAKILAIEFGPLSVFINNIASLGSFCPTATSSTTSIGTTPAYMTTTWESDIAAIPISSPEWSTGPIAFRSSCVPQSSEYEVISRAAAAANRNNSEIIYHGGTNRTNNSLDYNGVLSTGVFTNAITKLLNSSYTAEIPTLFTFREVAASVKKVVDLLMAGNYYTYRNFIVGRENIISQGFIYAPTTYVYSIRFDELYITWWVGALYNASLPI